MSEQADLVWKRIRDNARGSYPPEAYQFVREGLAHTVRMVYGQDEPDPSRPLRSTDPRHVSGQQLCLGLRDYAIRQYGLLARTVLAHWGIHGTEDFGRIVFTMIDAGLMRKGETDAPEDFEGVYDFDEAFPSPGQN